MASLPLQLVVLGAVLGAALAAAALILISFVAFVTATEMPPLHRHEEEKFFLNARGQKETLPSIRDSPTKQLSIVVPSYNEEKRLPIMMDEALGYLEERQVAFKYCQKYGSDKIRVITLVKNRGKGGAIKMGIFSSRGEKILMADADGATKFPDVEKLEKGLNDLQPWPRSYFRTLLMYGFHFLVWFLCVKGIRDTQCGFKLLTREAALRTFSSLHIERWAFDVELLYIAQFFKIPIAEIAVNWTEIEGCPRDRAILKGRAASPPPGETSDATREPTATPTRDLLPQLRTQESRDSSLPGSRLLRSLSRGRQNGGQVGGHVLRLLTEQIEETAELNNIHP
ncbi:dolichyl-phosphate beta-glucosyltransferase isoform X2 [Myotis lucifugus]|uniref:dolichyl-phosphate beta-glucosyltransferase isoform X2 n=1 Tax=Myotis lucifugus TaxID=59463 RepID=UPI000CCBEA7F|nr:dolichyl-phosphate beta-glucosyltransferase isoform X2 [Myotis lucifugus]